MIIQELSKNYPRIIQELSKNEQGELLVEIWTKLINEYVRAAVAGDEAAMSEHLAMIRSFALSAPKDLERSEQAFQAAKTFTIESDRLYREKLANHNKPLPDRLWPQFTLTAAMSAGYSYLEQLGQPLTRAECCCPGLIPGVLLVLTRLVRTGDAVARQLAERLEQLLAAFLDDLSLTAELAELQAADTQKEQ